MNENDFRPHEACVNGRGDGGEGTVFLARLGGVRKLTKAWRPDAPCGTNNTTNPITIPRNTQKHRRNEPIKATNFSQSRREDQSHFVETKYRCQPQAKFHCFLPM